MRTVKLITYNPETESYEMGLGTLTTDHFTSYDISCTDDLHVGRNLWVGDEFLTAEVIRNLKTTPDTLSLNSLRANEIYVNDKSVDERGTLSVHNIYMANVYGEQVVSNTADIGVITCSQVKFGDLTLNEALLSQLMNGSGSSSGGGSTSQENVYADYAYITNFVSARNFRINGGEYNSGSLQLGTHDFMYVQYNSETQVVNTYARGVFNADNAKIDRLGVRVLTVDGITFTSTPDVEAMYIASLTSGTGRFTSLNSDTGSFDSVSADEGNFDMIKLFETSFDGEYLKLGDDVVFRSYRNAQNDPIFSVSCTMFTDTLYVSNALNTSNVECTFVNASNSVTTPTIKLGNATEIQNNMALTLNRNYFDTLNSSVSTNSTDISNLSNVVQSTRSTVSSLQTSVSTLQTNVSSLQTNYSTLNSDVTGLKSANTNLYGLKVEPSVAFNQGNPEYSLTLVVNNPPEAGGSTQTHRYTCLTAENFDREISLGDKLADLYMPFGTFPEGSAYRTYPVGTMGLFMANNPNSTGYMAGMTTHGGALGDSPIRLYRVSMPISTASGGDTPQEFSVIVDFDVSLHGEWKLLNDCPHGRSLVLALRVS